MDHGPGASKATFDRVPYVGPAVFAALFAHARTLGYVFTVDAREADGGGTLNAIDTVKAKYSRSFAHNANWTRVAWRRDVSF